MASLQKTYSKEKLTGQIYTPDFVVKKILDDIGYNDKDILQKTILDPACGDGQFLIQIAKRIIKFSSKEKLKKNLLKIYGWDINKNELQIAKNRLNKLVEKFNIKIKWNLICKNSIVEKKSSTQKIKLFDFIVGNPPYIRIQHLQKEQRNYIQENYEFCKKGSTDIYIAFFELANKLLKNNGICGFITPNTYFHTETGNDLRRFFENNQNIQQITNYHSIQLFENISTYSAITIFTKNKEHKFLYQEAKTQKTFAKRNIDFTEIQNTKFWQLSAKKNKIKKGKRLGDICDIHVGLTTLADKAYIFNKIRDNKKTIIVETSLNGMNELEKGILKPIIKASTLKNGDEPINRYILFPYKKINNKNTIIAEKELKEKYPLAYKYLLSVKNVLDKRDNGKPNKVAWFAYGRTQSLNTSFGEKILFSPMNKKPNFILTKNTKATFYSGYCIKYEGHYEKLLEQLNSNRMQEYIKISSRDFRGGWKAYNKKIVQEFIIENN